MDVVAFDLGLVAIVYVPFPPFHKMARPLFIGRQKQVEWAYWPTKRRPATVTAWASMPTLLLYLMEMGALYCDLIVQRWERFTGKKAELVGLPTSQRSAAPSAGGSDASR